MAREFIPSSETGHVLLTTRVDATERKKLLSQIRQQILTVRSLWSEILKIRQELVIEPIIKP